MNRDLTNGAGEVVLYKAPDGEVRLEVTLERDTLWLTQSQIAKLFGVKVPAVSKHIKNIYATRELQPKSTVSKMDIVRTEGKRQVVIKDHPFADGNKRIGALLFLDYLRRNGMLMGGESRPRLPDNAMVALALLIAENEPAQKDLMTRLILNLLRMTPDERRQFH
jgi:hypothetical protein